MELFNIRSEKGRGSNIEKGMSRLSSLKSFDKFQEAINPDLDAKRAERYHALVKRFNLLLPDVLLGMVDLSASLDENF